MAEQSVAAVIGTTDAGSVDIFLKSGPCQTAAMATVVTFAGQTAAQLGIAEPGPTVAAIAFAVLIAAYNVRTVQRRQGLSCAILIPIVALVTFVSGWGANGLISLAAAKGQTAREEATRFPPATLQKENEILRKSLELYEEQLKILRPLSGVSADQLSETSGHGEDGPTARLLSRFLDVLVPSALAQPATASGEPLTSAQREGLLEQLREHQMKQQELSAEAEHLRREREKEMKMRREQVEQAPAGLWRKW